VYSPSATPPRPLRLSGSPLPVVGRLRAYVCGITPYDVTHLGHATTYLWTDLALRVARTQGIVTTLARNVTDVDEALVREAHRRGTTPDLLGALQRAAFDGTMAALRIRRPELEPTAAQAVGQVVQLTAALLAADRAYVGDGGVYARTRDARVRAHLDEQAATELAREYGDDPDAPGKEHPLDVLVWRTAGEGEASWPSPWGPGRPGWHAECAAMSLTAFGSSVDLHAGGADLRFPHHAVEATLAEAVTGVAPFARAWLHAGLVRIDGAKMAKSAGNLVMVDDLVASAGAATVRMLCLGRPWAADWDYTPQELADAGTRLEGLYAAAGRPDPAEAAAEAVTAALLDDLDTPRALAIAVEAGGGAARRLVEILDVG
jgi:cysteinyl-tRNA synthetase